MTSFQIRKDARIDLHTHSLRSDGRGTPAQVMREAAEAGLNIVALTDHDTVEGWSEASAQATALGLGFIPGIEVTTRVQRNVKHKFTVHMLAYLPNPESPVLAKMLADSVASRHLRLQEITALLSEDFDISWDHVAEVLADGKVGGRPAIADAMIARGILETREPFFKIVTQGTKYYVPNRGVPETVDAIAAIRAAGGVPILAHPMARGAGPNPGDPMPRAHFVELIEAGLGGFETGHRDVAPHVVEWLSGLAVEFDLVTTGSSDYHGTGKQNRLGEHQTSADSLERIIAQAGANAIPPQLPHTVLAG